MAEQNQMGLFVGVLPVRSSKLLFVAVSLALVVQASAFGESKWSLSNLIPGGKTSGKTSLPRPEGQSLTKKQSGSAFTAPFKRIGNDTKKLFGKTKSLVPSWAFPESRKKAKKSSNVVADSFHKVNSEVKVAHRKMLEPWKKLGKDPEPKKPRTVGEFLSLDRPK
jgi:hypothetical protein